MPLSTQQRILLLLSDGEPHTVHELQCCLFDKLGPVSNIHYHLTCARKKLRRKNQDIICKMIGTKSYYQWVTIIKLTEEEKKDARAKLPKE
jgi:hypothetical protein